AVDVCAVVEGTLAATSGIGYAHRWYPTGHADSFRAWVGAEVRVERPVLLHHHHDVLDLRSGDDGVRRRPCDQRRAGRRVPVQAVHPIATTSAAAAADILPGIPRDPQLRFSTPHTHHVRAV